MMGGAQLTQHVPSKTLPIVAIIISVAVVGFATGMTIPLLSLRLVQQGKNDFLIGCVAALPAFGFVISAPILHHLLRWCTRRQLVLLCFVASALSILLLEASMDFRIWLPLRLVMGAASGVIVAIGEAWINELADDQKRGRIVASYTTTFTVCQLFGPLVIAMLGASSHWPILISTLLHGAVALLFLLLIKSETTQAVAEEDAKPLSIARFILHAPALCCAVLFFSFFDGTILSLFPVFGMHYGYSAAVAAFMVSVILCGDAILQLPLGWLADHMNQQRLHQYCGWLTLGLALSLASLMGNLWLLYPALLILGATAGGIYTLALIQIGQIYRGNDLVTANAAAGMLWGVGSLIGPVFGGAALALGSNGLPLTIAIAVLLFIVMSYAKPLSLPKDCVQNPE
jgi:MFS family permease